MSEVVKQVRMLPLNELHVRLGGDMTESDGWLLPASYGDVLREYAAVRERGAGVIDLSHRGRIRVSGAEVVQFLNGLITNDVKTLSENSWLPAVFPNVQGRLIASVKVIRLADEASGKGSVPVFIVETEPATHDSVLKTLDRFTLAGDFQVADLSTSTVLLSLQGKQAAEILGRVFGLDESAELSEHGARSVVWHEVNVQVVHMSHTAQDGFDLIVDSDHSNKLWEALLQQGARPIGFAALEILRIEAGISRHGVDIDENLVVSETNLDDSISFTKGCYIGQEIIARIKYRGHVAKKLTGIRFDRPTHLEPGATVKSKDDKDIGRLTSITFSPHLGTTIALGLIKYDYLAPATEIKIDGFTSGMITELPFVS